MTEGRREGDDRMRWLDGITNSVNMNLSKFQEIVKFRGAWHAAVHADQVFGALGLGNGRVLDSPSDLLCLS